MQINNVNNQNFKGMINMPANMRPILERGIINTLQENQRALLRVPVLVDELHHLHPNTNIRIIGKPEIINPKADSDFDVFIENTALMTSKKIEQGSTLAKRFLSALYEATKK